MGTQEEKTIKSGARREQGVEKLEAKRLSGDASESLTFSVELDRHSGEARHWFFIYKRYQGALV